METSTDRGGWWAQWGHKELEWLTLSDLQMVQAGEDLLQKKCSIFSLYEPVFRIRNCSLSYSKITNEVCFVLSSVIKSDEFCFRDCFISFVFGGGGKRPAEDTSVLFPCLCLLGASVYEWILDPFTPKSIDSSLISAPFIIREETEGQSDLAFARITHLASSRLQVRFQVHATNAHFGTPPLE